MAASAARLIDLRSDTVTRPCSGMRKAMSEAEVGDDIYREDPTVHRLEETIAEATGKEAALFVSSGTLGNQLALMTLTERGDEVLIGKGAHCAHYESGAGGGVTHVQFVELGETGLFDAQHVEAALHPEAYYLPRTRVLAVENTHNRAGGRVFPAEQVERVTAIARAHGLLTHLDGARLWNASVATGRPLAELSAPFDTVSICFSKGLGAPVGSALCTTRERIDRALRFRKMLGGGMRQAGILAAGALFAFEKNRDRLAQDHDNARTFADSINASGELEALAPETNIINLRLRDRPSGAADLALRVRARGVLLNATGPSSLRAVTHLDVTRDDVAMAADILREAAAELSQ